jgi:hypothetical protein
MGGVGQGVNARHHSPTNPLDSNVPCMRNKHEGIGSISSPKRIPGISEL